MLYNIENAVNVTKHIYIVVITSLVHSSPYDDKDTMVGYRQVTWILNKLRLLKVN